ncbi:hypothetical protein KORDIASMS9_02604 [Kordia sp. SMS9]|uniref:hypothetical protein n=1 Tax=Kordia sp. SMS9 TaxID=2282170 RepID=UPI000E106DF0|nr:hypothetical protein [Kordia sp. SMS9]AXG70365.1 hypothetical protein KORDIASMS9_02604 [Kordia sp. SMS9]
MNKAFPLLLCIFYFACADSSQKETKTVASTTTSEIKKTIAIDPKTIDSTKLNLNFTPKGNYEAIKQSITRDRSYFSKKLRHGKQKTIDSAAAYLYDKLLNELIPHWYGTPWDFNGHTNIPNSGEIACGYFVSTTLKHLGFKLNRYKMAQQAGLNEAMTLQAKNNLKIYRNISQNDLKTKINQVYRDGLYFVGLSNHVGYVLIKNRELYFLHSSYCDNIVVIEKAATSPCFQSDMYVFAEITTNEELVQKWIQNSAIPIQQ